MPTLPKQPAKQPTKKPIVEPPTKTVPPIAAREIKMPAKKISRATIAVIVLAAVAVISTGMATFCYHEYQDLKKNPTKIVDDENQDLINKVGRLMVLPTGETPTVATVTDLAPLKDQPFFANAKVGYKVIIYTNAKRAILYDPVNDKIVETAPLNMGQAPAPVEKANTNTNAP